MSKNSSEARPNRYQEADFLQPEHTEAVERFLTDHSRADVEKFIEENRLVYKLGEQAFKALLHIPPEPSDQVVVVPTGLFADFNANAVVQAMAIREVVDPHATLVVQANAALQSVNNFSAAEGKQLRQEGDLQPMRDRLNIVLDDVAGELPDARVAYSGASLGAAVAGNALAHDSEMILPSNAGTIIEPVNITRRRLPVLGYDFARSVGDMGEVFNENFPDGWLKGARYEQELQSEDALLQRYMGRIASFGAALAEIYNLAQALGKDQLSEDLPAAPQDVPIVHMWSKHSKISPNSINEAIAEEMRKSGHPNYESLSIEDPTSQHGLTVDFAAHGAALERAIRLSQQGKG